MKLVIENINSLNNEMCIFYVCVTANIYLRIKVYRTYLYILNNHHYNSRNRCYCLLYFEGKI